jgi:putative urate catabolism protein
LKRLPSSGHIGESALQFYAVIVPNAYPRDLFGYGAHPPHPQWPNGARLALSFVLNYEEGGEQCILHGDTHSEFRLTDIGGQEPLAGVRNMQVESNFEYGSRVGFWQLLELFRVRDLPLTVFGVGMALERNPEVVDAIVEAGHELTPHAWRWIDYQFVSEDVEREHIRKAISTIERMTGERPVGWYTGRNSPNTRRLIVEEGGFLYDSDAYNDDLPYWMTVNGKAHLVIPYTLDNNDGRVGSGGDFALGDDFFTYLKDAFDWLYSLGKQAPRMMSVGLHCRIIGRPGRIGGLERFLDYIREQNDVWICRRIDIARHWHTKHPYSAPPATAGDRSKLSC